MSNLALDKVNTLIDQLNALDSSIYALKQQVEAAKEAILFPEDHNDQEIAQSQLFAMTAFNQFQTQLGVYSDH